jgi:aminoglycoside N3'-acetyltransferase
MNSLSLLKKKYFPKGVKRSLNRYYCQFFNPTTEKSLVANFKKLEIQAGSAICVHSMLSSLGHIVGGPQTVISAIQKAVPNCTIMMPSFPFDGSAFDYLKTDPIYQRDTTPSKSGLLTETLRLFPGAKRSYHPTHPCVAIGPLADYLIDGSEHSETPFGNNSTYGRFSALDNGVVLLIHTNNTSMVHRIQEMVDMPNLFGQENLYAKGYDASNSIREYKVKVHTPILPLYVVMESIDHEREYIWFPDYVLLFPEYNRLRILQKIKSKEIAHSLIERHDYFMNSKVYRMVTRKNMELAAIQLKPWLERLCYDLNESIERFADKYKRSSLENAAHNSLLSK